MKKSLLAVALGLVVMASSGQHASAYGPLRLGINVGCCSYCITIAGSGHCGRCGSGCTSCSPCGGCAPCGGCGGCAAGQIGPWYQYWPYAAHFSVPAPVGYPYWPTMSDGADYGHGYGYAYPAAPAGYPGVTPVSYYGNAPAYWYGR